MAKAKERFPRASEQTQMNIRIDKRLKERGDAALANAGFTPSQAVRTIWEFAAEHEQDPEKIVETLDPERAERARRDRENERKESLEEYDRVIREMREFSEEIRARRVAAGLPPTSGVEKLSYKELRELAYLDRLEERGLA